MRIIRLLAMSVLFLAQPALAQEISGDIDIEVGEYEEEDALAAELKQAKAPDGSEDYDELNAMHVLERNLLTGTNADIALPEVQTQNPSNLILSNDPLDLSYASVLDLLLDESEETQTPGLQQQSTRIMAQALSQVQKILDASNKTTGLIKPFGLDCFDEPAVREYLALYSASGSKGFKVWLKRAGKWREIVENVMREEGVPGDLLYLAMIESGFKTRVKSPKAAGGMWQFMPGTAIEQGLRIDSWVDERFDPIKAAHAAARYLKKQYNRYDSWPLAMAAYNGGPGLVNSAIDKYNSNDFFKLVSYGAMFDETRRYAPKILAATIIGKNPAAFGFEGLDAEKPLRFDTIEVPGATRLERVAEAAGCSLETIEDLNPELLKNQTPPDETWVLRIPLGSSKKFVEKFDNLNSKYNSTETIELKFGQSVELIAEQSGHPARVIRALNQLGPRESASYGDNILVPKGTAAKLKEYEAHKSQPSSKKESKEPEKPLALIPPKEFTISNAQRIFYRTQRGDRIDAIAEAFGVMPNQLALWNDLVTYARLRPNMMLQIYVSPKTDLSKVIYYNENELNVVIIGSDAHLALIDSKNRATQSKAKTAAAAVAAPKITYYTVGKGDSLSKIAKKYGVTVEQLMKWNKLKNAGAIRTGQKLIVKK